MPAEPEALRGPIAEMVGREPDEQETDERHSAYREADRQHDAE